MRTIDGIEYTYEQLNEACGECDCDIECWVNDWDASASDAYKTCPFILEHILKQVLK